MEFRLEYCKMKGTKPCHVHWNSSQDKSRRRRTAKSTMHLFLLKCADLRIVLCPHFTSSSVCPIANAYRYDTRKSSTFLLKSFRMMSLTVQKYKLKYCRPMVKPQAIWCSLLQIFYLSAFLHFFVTFALSFLCPQQESVALTKEHRMAADPVSS